MDRRVAILAPAKVNLSLRVLGKRDDGYHEVETLMQSIDLTDHLSVELGGRGVELVVEGPWLGPLEENLAYRAAVAYRQATGVDRGVRVELRKGIPAGAGLGGGSSDAGAVLACLAALTGAADRRTLSTLGAELGSDVPFFLCGSPLAQASGRGDVVQPLPPLPTGHLVVVTPPLHVSTSRAYAALAIRRRAGRPRVDNPARPADWAEVAADARNDFQCVIEASHPEVRRSLSALGAAGARFVLLSGSGAASFGLFGAADEASAAADAITNEIGWPAVATATLSSVPGPEPLEKP